MIEVGEYCRCKKFGRIFKYIRSFYDDMQFYVYAEPNWQFVYESEEEFISSIKHSKNIIKLLKAGDYVNGHLVYRIDNNITIWLETKTNTYCGIYEKDIKSILTHEMYEQNCYKVGDIE